MMLSTVLEMPLPPGSIAHEDESSMRKEQTNKERIAMKPRTRRSPNFSDKLVC
jgi:hypothetical protein